MLQALRLSFLGDYIIPEAIEKQLNQTSGLSASEQMLLSSGYRSSYLVDSFAILSILALLCLFNSITYLLAYMSRDGRLKRLAEAMASFTIRFLLVFCFELWLCSLLELRKQSGELESIFSTA